MRKSLSICLLLLVLFIVAALIWPWLATRGEGVHRIDRELIAVQVALDQYKNQYGLYPSGDSATICRVLAGDNRDKLIFLEWQPKSTSAKGEFLDPWGTPYRIYFSGNEPLIRSAGQNKQFDSTGDKDFDDYFGG
jgi:hypothetical protein